MSLKLTLMYIPAYFPSKTIILYYININIYLCQNCYWKIVYIFETNRGIFTAIKKWCGWRYYRFRNPSLSKNPDSIAQHDELLENKLQIRDSKTNKKKNVCLLLRYSYLQTHLTIRFITKKYINYVFHKKYYIRISGFKKKKKINIQRTELFALQCTKPICNNKIIDV